MEVRFSVVPPTARTFGDVAGHSGPYQSPFYIRSPARNNFDMTFFKNFNFSESKKLQFRFEMINAFNRVWFGGLDTSVTSATYTKLTSQANQPRNIQLGLKLSF